MKKLRLLFVLAFVGMISMVGAQTSMFGIKGGLNMSNFYGDELTDKNMKAGFNIGVTADLGLTNEVYLQTGLFYSSKGAKYHYDIPIVGDLEYNVTANYLELPVHVAYKLDVTPGTKVVFHAGPYVAYGIGGKRKVVSNFTQDMEDIIGKQDLNTFDKDYGFKPFDAGVGLGVGAEFGVISVDLGWDMGLTNISRLKDGNVKNQNAYLSLGYKF